ncbi:MAG: hypothetical protein ACI4VM_01755 [Anaerovoracaceae bacterium]
MTKATEGQKKLLILLLAIVMVAGVWRFVYTPLSEKSDQLELEIEELQTQVDNLRSLNEQKEMFIERTAAFDTETAAIVNKYGPGNTPEKIIMFLVDLSKKTNMTIPSVSFGQETNVTVLADGTELSEAGMTRQDVSSADGEAAEGSDEGAAGGTEDVSSGKVSDYYLYNYPVTFSITVSYSGLKEALTYIQEYSERAVVDNISLGYDSATGRLTGSITLNMYTMTGTAKPYLAPQIDGISLGVANIFGSVQ